MCSALYSVLSSQWGVWTDSPLVLSCSCFSSLHEALGEEQLKYEQRVGLVW